MWRRSAADLHKHNGERREILTWHLSESGREITRTSFTVRTCVGGNAMGLALWMIGTLVAAVAVANMPSGRPETPRH
jgi:hypothetical protein